MSEGSESSGGIVTSAQVLSRLNRLERENRRLRLAAIAGAILITVLAAGGARFAIPDKVEAREFVVRDSEDRVIATLGPNFVTGTPELNLFDPASPNRVIRAQYGLSSLAFLGKVANGINDRLVLGMSDENRTALSIRDEAGKTRLQLGLFENRVSYNLYDSDGQIRVAMYLERENSPVIALLDDAKRVKASIAVESDGTPSLKLLRINTNASLRIGGAPDSPAGLWLSDDSGRDRLAAELEPKGNVLFRVVDQQGKSLLHVSSSGSK